MNKVGKALMGRRAHMRLSHLDLSKNHNISDVCVRNLFKSICARLDKLECINLSYANITDKICADIHNFYMEKEGKHRCLHKIDLSFTRISQNGLFVLDELFNKLVVKISGSPKACKSKKNKKMKKKKKEKTEKDGRERRKQSFEILLKGCFFQPMLCKNYNATASVPKLQTFCTEA